MSSDSDFEHEKPVRTLRDLIAPIFRHGRAGILVACAVFAAAAILVMLRPEQYESEMKILVKRERVDPLVTGNPDVQPTIRTDVNEDDLNSEVELLKSRDLLAQVAAAVGLDDKSSKSGDALPRAVQRLQSNLRISPIRRTSFIRVTYRASDPAIAARVLSELARLYPERHLALHRPNGAYDFFTEQAEAFRNQLSEAEARLQRFANEEHVVSAELEKQNTLQRLADFEAALEQARGSLADATRRIDELESEAVATPARHTTQIRTSENRELIGELKSRILSLEVKHGEMLRKFAPTYPPAALVEQELQQARAALAFAEQAPMTEQTTDHNPTHQWLQAELARVKTERAAAVGRADALASSVTLYRRKARELDAKSAAQEDLTRARKHAQDNYELYRRKQEEARISDALDRTRIVNVAVAEAPTVPSAPATVRSIWLLMLGAIVGGVLGVATTYVLDYLSPYFHTPQEVEATLGIPVLASLPARR